MQKFFGASLHPPTLPGGSVTPIGRLSTLGSTAVAASQKGPSSSSAVCEQKDKAPVHALHHEAHAELPRLGEALGTSVHMKKRDSSPTAAGFAAARVKESIRRAGQLAMPKDRTSVPVGLSLLPKTEDIEANSRIAEKAQTALPVEAEPPLSTIGNSSGSSELVGGDRGRTIRHGCLQPCGDHDPSPDSSRLDEMQGQLSSIRTVVLQLNSKLDMAQCGHPKSIARDGQPISPGSAGGLREHMRSIQSAIDELMQRVTEGHATLGAQLNDIHELVGARSPVHHGSKPHHRRGPRRQYSEDGMASEMAITPVLEVTHCDCPTLQDGFPRVEEEIFPSERQPISHGGPLSPRFEKPLTARGPRQGHGRSDGSSPFGAPRRDSDDIHGYSWDTTILHDRHIEDMYGVNHSLDYVMDNSSRMAVVQAIASSVRGSRSNASSRQAPTTVSSSISSLLGGGAPGASRVRSAPSLFRVDGESNTEKALQTFTLLMVVSYIIFLGVWVDFRIKFIKKGMSEFPRFFQWMDLGFVILMALELLAYLAFKGWNAFSGSGRKWAIFDAVLVSFAVLDQAIAVFDPTFILMSRVFRAARFARVIKTMRDMQDLRLMVAAILCSLSSIMWAIVLLFFVIYLFAVAMLLFVTSSGDVTAESSLMFEYYGSLAQTMTTLFGAISGGKDWGDLMKPVSEVSENFARVYFVVYISLTLFGIMNILTAVFVRNTGQIAKIDRELVIMEEHQNTEKAKAAMRKLMREADANDNGIITGEELEHQLRRHGTILYLKSLDIDEADVRRLFGLLAEDNQVDTDDFLDGMLKLRGQAKALDTASLMLESNRRGEEMRALLRYIEDRFDVLTEQALPPAQYLPLRHRRVTDYVEEEKEVGKSAMQRIDRLASVGHAEQKRSSRDGAPKSPRPQSSEPGVRTAQI